MSPRVLVIDDHAAIREALATVLRSAGYAVTTAVDGEDGIRVLERRGFDLIVTDILMPNRDGLEVIAAARALQVRTPVIVTSEPHLSGALDLLNLATQLGADAAIAKPVEPQRLLVAAAELLDSVHRLGRDGD